MQASINIYMPHAAKTVTVAFCVAAGVEINWDARKCASPFFHVGGGGGGSEGA